MYASPSAVVNKVAVPPEITPPATVPTPGIIFNKFETIVFPTNVVLPVPITAEIRVVSIALLGSNPKATVMDASIVTSIGINIAASGIERPDRD